MAVPAGLFGEPVELVVGVPKLDRGLYPVGSARAVGSPESAAPDRTASTVAT